MILTRMPESEAQLLDLLRWGATLAHEADHYENDSIWRSVEDEEDRVLSKIDNPLSGALTKAILQKPAGGVSSCSGKSGSWEIRSQLDQFACECGIALSSGRGGTP
jgi:hypothetical protein